MSNYSCNAKMTNRRHQMLKLIAKGFNNEQIAKEMELTLTHVKLQKWRLYSHLKTHSQSEAILTGLRKNYLTLEDIEVKNKSEIIKIYKEGQSG